MIVEPSTGDCTIWTKGRFHLELECTCQFSQATCCGNSHQAHCQLQSSQIVTPCSQKPGNHMVFIFHPNCLTIFISHKTAAALPFNHHLGDGADHLSHQNNCILITDLQTHRLTDLQTHRFANLQTYKLTDICTFTHDLCRSFCC